MDRESSIDIDDKLDFELAITLKNKIIKKEKICKIIQDEIEDKKETFNQKNDDEKSIVLIGHGQIGNWKIKKLLNYKVLNYGINRISSFQYYNFILKKNLLKCNTKKYIIMHGTNDIIYDKTNREIYESIMKNIN